MVGAAPNVNLGPIDFVSEPLCKTLSKFMGVKFHSWQVASEFVPGSRIVGAFSRFLNLKQATIHTATQQFKQHLPLESREVTSFDMSAKEKLTSKLVGGAVR